MNKEDLKSGMILEFSNKNRGLILDNEIFLINKESKKFNGSLSTSYFKTKDNKPYIEKYKIIALYQANTPDNTNIGTDLNRFTFYSEYLTTIWKQQIIEQLTLEQVCKELGRKIEIIEG